MAHIISHKEIAFDRLRRLCGYVEDGSSTVVSIFQDDATRMWHIKIKFNHMTTKSYYNESFTGVINEAWEANKPEY